MSKIEKYVDEIVSGLPISQDEQQEMKEEIMMHLFDHIDELMIKGYSKEEAISQAIESFGKGKTIHKEMKKVLFPYYKFIRFGWSIVFVATMLCLTSHLLTKMYFPQYDSPISIGTFAFVIGISILFLGAAELMYDATLKEYRSKWLTNPWSFFLIPAFLLEIVMYLEYLKTTNSDDLWIWHDSLFIPLYLVFYVVSRQLFTWLFVKKEDASNKGLLS